MAVDVPIGEQAPAATPSCAAGACVGLNVPAGAGGAAVAAPAGAPAGAAARAAAGAGGGACAAAGAVGPVGRWRFVRVADTAGSIRFILISSSFPAYIPSFAPKRLLLPPRKARRGEPLVTFDIADLSILLRHSAGASLLAPVKLEFAKDGKHITAMGPPTYMQGDDAHLWAWVAQQVSFCDIGDPCAAVPDALSVGHYSYWNGSEWCLIMSVADVAALFVVAMASVAGTRERPTIAIASSLQSLAEKPAALFANADPLTVAPAQASALVALESYLESLATRAPVPAAAAGAPAGAAQREPVYRVGLPRPNAQRVQDVARVDDTVILGSYHVGVPVQHVQSAPPQPLRIP